MRSSYRTLLIVGLLVTLLGDVAYSQEREGFFERARKRLTEAISSSKAPSFHERRNPQVLEAFKESVEEVQKSVVRIYGEGGQVAMGIVVDANGLVATKYGDLVGELSCKLPDGQSIQAEFAAIDKARDLALLRVNRTDLKPVNWSASMDIPPLGKWVVTPGNGNLPLSVGVIAAPPREIPAEPAFLGVSLANMDSGGVQITELLEGGFAQKADILRVNDVVIEIDGVEVQTIEDMKKIIAGRRPLTAIQVKFNRGEDVLNRWFLLGRRSDAKLFQQDQRMRFQQELGGRISERRDSFPLVIQHDAVLKPEECGSPIVNLDGEVIGLNIARASRISSYALPLSELLPSVEEMRKGMGEDLIAERRVLIERKKEAKQRVADAKKAFEVAKEEHASSLKELKTVRVAVKQDDADDELQQQLQAAVERSEALKEKSKEAELESILAENELKDVEAMLVSLRN